MKIISVTTLLLVFLFAVNPAFALRCGNKLVKLDMHEAEIRALCGEPASTATVGYVVRYYDTRKRRSPLHKRFDTHHFYGRAEVLVTESLYNFGPRKLMRRLRFEGGRLTDIETAGYGYRESD